MKIIPLTQGKTTLVDELDYVRVSQFKWLAIRIGYHFYAARHAQGRRIYLHRELIQPPDGYQVDHVNGDGLDNRRANLRAATSVENARAVRHLRKNKSSRFRGVSWNKRNRRWMAYIMHKRPRKFLGYFTSEEDAARAYDIAAKELFGEFASPNFIGASPTIPGAWVLRCRAIRFLDALPDPV